MPLLELVIAGADEELANRVRAVLHRPPVLRKRDTPPQNIAPSEIKQLAQKSLEKGYLKDAVK